MLLAGVEAQALDCTFSTTGVAFGVYDPVATTPSTATGNLTVTCTHAGGGATRVNYTAALSTGNSGTYSQRRMRAGGAVLNYNLFDGASYTRVWGNGTAGTGVIVGALLVNPGNNQVNEAFHPIYGYLRRSRKRRSQLQRHDPGHADVLRPGLRAAWPTGGWAVRSCPLGVGPSTKR